MKKERRKKKKTVRTRDWDPEHDDSFTHDLKRHRRTDTALPDLPPLHEVPEDFEPNALVISHTKKWAFVQWEGAEHRCRIAEDLAESGATLLAAGDQVLVEVVEDGNPIVRAVQERRTRLSRPAIEGSRVAEQVIAANIDILLIVTAAARPQFQPGLVDRYLIIAEQGGVTPHLCVNKIDLVEQEPSQIQIYRDIGLPVLLTSCVTGQGLDDLRQVLEGRFSAFAGKSGVGKSSLLNVLDPSLDIATREVSDSTRKGKHTTAASRLYDLPGGIRVIDTPGIRQLGLAHVTQEQLGFYFPEIADHAPQCRFRDCTHTHEPHCAVREAVDQDQITDPRYQSYLRIRASLQDQKKY